MPRAVLAEKLLGIQRIAGQVDVVAARHVGHAKLVEWRRDGIDRKP